MSAMYRIADSSLVGIVTTRDILPGDVIFRDGKALVNMPFEARTFDAEAKNLAALLTMVEEVLSKEDRTTLLSLPCGNLASFDSFADCTIHALEMKGLIKVKDNAHYARLRKLIKVVRLYGTRIYATGSYVEHSCWPNCALIHSPTDGSQECIAIQPIKVGSSLGASYIDLRDKVSTSDRRRELLQSFEFTCHCPRCDAPGDDTRQFACFDPACTGRHYVCQPLHSQTLENSDVSFTGVTYVEPHLLP
jgi:hypothetical protein